MSRSDKDTEEKREREGPLSMYPLSPDEALKGILRVPKEALDDREKQRKNEEARDGGEPDD